MSSSTAAAPVRAWRAAFLTLRDETLTPPAPSGALRLLRSLLISPDPLLAAAPHVPSHEVTSDLTLLSELACLVMPQSPEADGISVSVCRFLYSVSCKARIEVNPSSWKPFLNFAENMANCLLGEAEKKKLFIGDSVRMESLFEMTEFLRFLTRVYGRSCTLSENIHLVKTLLQLVWSLPTEFLINFNPDFLSRSTADIGIKVLLFAITGISDALSRIGPSLPVDLWQSLLEALRKFLDALTFKNSLIESLAMSRFYASCLQCLHLVLSAPKASFSEHVSGFVVALQMFFTYGISFRPSMLPANGAMKNALGSSSMTPALARKALDGVYRPPHLRKREVHQAQDAQISSSTDSLNCGFTSSDSEKSDSDGFLNEDDRFKSSKVRLAAFLCIQDICQVAPGSLASLLSILLPTNDVLQPRKNQATIMTSLLFDPVLKVRISSASTLASIIEGNSTVLLQVSEYKESIKCGSYTTLSSSLGQILMQVHKGIMYLIQHETRSALLAPIFKVLLPLISATPYNRMPAELLPSVIESVRARMVEELSVSKIDLSILVSTFSCMASALLSSPPSSHVLDMLKKELTIDFTLGQGNSSISGIIFGFSQGNYHPCVRFEALKVLQAIAHNYSHVTNALWETISSTILQILQTSIIEDPSVNAAPSARKGEMRSASGLCNDKCKVAAIKVLDSCLRASSGFKGVDDSLDCKSVDTQYFIDSTREIKVSSAPLYILDGSEFASGNSSEYPNGAKHWCEAIERHIPVVLKHSSPLIRAATLTCFAGLTSAVYFSLADEKQSLIISSVVGATLNDGVPSVRSAGCRALGVLSSFSEIFSSKRILEDFIHAAEKNLHDPSLSVRITASWALANMCDSLRRRETDLPLEFPERSIDPRIVSLLVENSLRLTSDSDKVKANAVRALGNLSRFVKFTDYVCCSKYSSSSDGLHWLERMVQAFVSCVTTGNVKVQWNVCYSLGNLFLNPTVKLHDVSWSSSVYTILLLLLRDSTNFKIRIHAAVALAVPLSRLDYGSSFANIVQGIVLVLETLDAVQGSAPSNAKYKDALEKQKAPFLEEWLKCLCAQFLKSPEKQMEELDMKDAMSATTSEPMKAILSNTIRTLTEVYRYSNNPSISSRFQKLLDCLS